MAALERLAAGPALEVLPRAPVGADQPAGAAVGGTQQLEAHEPLAGGDQPRAVGEALGELLGALRGDLDGVDGDEHGWAPPAVDGLWTRRPEAYSPAAFLRREVRAFEPDAAAARPSSGLLDLAASTLARSASIRSTTFEGSASSAKVISSPWTFLAMASSRAARYASWNSSGWKSSRRRTVARCSFSRKATLASATLPSSPMASRSRW